jgi:hypothetical protein
MGIARARSASRSNRAITPAAAGRTLNCPHGTTGVSQSPGCQHDTVDMSFSIQQDRGGMRQFLESEEKPNWHRPWGMPSTTKIASALSAIAHLVQIDGALPEKLQTRLAGPAYQLYGKLAILSLDAQSELREAIFRAAEEVESLGFLTPAEILDVIAWIGSAHGFGPKA